MDSEVPTPTLSHHHLERMRLDLPTRMHTHSQHEAFRFLTSARPVIPCARLHCADNDKTRQEQTMFMTSLWVA
ncbi:hypothetical protein FVEG_00791 [Fusarium verticillioides 7600]|uniref:Uncharacterized protein n=1 Tax=Gibberella moniliformis (strain M3125 / FGSC 7600) TaxID=334819 RepID=W7LN98_GIBM7|nr:hypothetical protein FVEG_00791 [Fusarium verticillioides 7600]EWG36955.1 hypothetical protein FVEG_00791 [Fusarium verticillioides 7600]